jgi:phage FluMu protein gp41
MATVKFDLKEGIKIGEAVYIAAEIREASAGDLIDAADESEKLIATPDGYQLLASPTLVGLNTLRRQIVCIGDYKGPLTLSELKKLSAADLSLLQEKALTLEDASLKKVIDRGE